MAPGFDQKRADSRTDRKILDFGCRIIYIGLVRDLLSLLFLTLLLAVSRVAAARDLEIVALSGQQIAGMPAGTALGSFAGFRMFEFNDLGQLAVRASITGLPERPNPAHGLFLFDDHQLNLLTRQGNAAPGTESGTIFDGFASLSLSSAGHVAFDATLEGETVTDDNGRGIWIAGAGQTELALRSGEEVPGLPAGSVFSNLNLPQVNRNGDVTFYGGLTGVENVGGLFHFSDGVASVVAQGMGVAPGVPDEKVFSTILPRFSLNDRGETTFVAWAVDVTNGPSAAQEKSIRQTGIWRESEGVLVALALSRASLSRSNSEWKLEVLEWADVVFNAEGDTAFLGVSAIVEGTGRRRAIWQIDADGANEVVGSDDSFPSSADGQRIGFLLDVFLGSESSLAMAASGREESSDRTYLGIFARDGESYRLVARTAQPSGDPVAPGNANQLRYPQINQHQQVAFYADGRDGSAGFRSLWAEDLAGNLVKIAAEGESIETSPGIFHKILQLHYPESQTIFEPPRYFNNRGQIVFAATLDDGTSGLFLSNRVAIPEPTTLAFTVLAGTVFLLRPGGLWRVACGNRG